MLTDSPFYVPLMARLFGRKSLVHLRGDPWSELHYDGAMYPSFLKRLYTRYLESMNDWSIRANYIVFANSKWLKNQIGAHMPSFPTRVLYVGINPKHWSLKGNRESILPFNMRYPSVAGVFQFNQYAKVLGILKFTKVVRKMKDVNFYFAGTGPYFNTVKQECPSNMFLVGRLTELQLKCYLERADLFVHPSGLDALPRSVKEASLMEKPMVVSDEGGIPEIVKNGQTGYLCGINEVDLWIEKIRFLLDNPSAASKLGRNARKFVASNFSWNKIAEGFLTDITTFRK